MPDRNPTRIYLVDLDLKILLQILTLLVTLKTVKVLFFNPQKIGTLIQRTE
jgi:hypothetical protein